MPFDHFNTHKQTLTNTWTLYHILVDAAALEEPLAMGLTAFAAAQEMTHGPNQTVLEILGARLAQDELQETRYDMYDSDVPIENEAG